MLHIIFPVSLATKYSLGDVKNMPLPGIERVNSQETYGTCEETVLANNRGRLVVVPQTLQPTKNTLGLTTDSSLVLGLDEIGTISTDGTGDSRDLYTGTRSYSTGASRDSYQLQSYSHDRSVGVRLTSPATKKTLSRQRSAGSTKKEKDRCIDLVKFIFCLGTDTTIVKENRSPGNAERGRVQLSSPRLSSTSIGSPSEESTMSMGSPSKKNNRSTCPPRPPRASNSSLQILQNSSTKSMKKNSSKESMNLTVSQSRDSFRNQRSHSRTSGGSNKSLKNRKVSPIDTHSNDAKILEKIMKESNEKQQDFKCRSTGVSPLGAAGIDIVMELQQQEATVPGSGSKGKKKKSKGSKKSQIKGNVPVPKEDDLVVARIEDMFRFNKDKINESTSPSRRRNSSNNISGAPNGTFKNISTKESALHEEAVNTYMNYRVDNRTIDRVLNRLACNLPLYHHGANRSMRREDSELSTISTAGISSKIKNVCSEPVSKLFQVRGPSYLADGIKIPSDETMFALLGADSVLKAKKQDYRECDVSKAKYSYLNNLRAASTKVGMKAPFLIVINFVVPWGNLLAYFYRPDGDQGHPHNSSRKDVKSERLWNSFLQSDTETRNKTLKFIPSVTEGPWALKKLVGTNPAIIGQKIPTSYFGSVEDGYLEICMNVTKGGKVANSICNAVASKSSIVSLDLAFLLQGSGDNDLPEQLLTVMRLHHVSLKKVHIVPK